MFTTLFQLTHKFQEPFLIKKKNVVNIFYSTVLYNRGHNFTFVTRNTESEQ
jgi:hypothetical protein